MLAHAASPVGVEIGSSLRVTAAPRIRFQANPLAAKDESALPTTHSEAAEPWQK
jgi:hypothetical protein